MKRLKLVKDCHSNPILGYYGGSFANDDISVLCAQLYENDPSQKSKLS